MPGALRWYDEDSPEILLSEALDHTNRTFQPVHMAGLVEQRALLDGLFGARLTPIGINCRICPRANCDQRAHHAAILTPTGG